MNIPQLPASIEKVLKVFEKEFPTGVPSFRKVLLKEFSHQKEELRKIVESKKKAYWHIQFEGIDDPEELRRRKKFNQEVTILINSVLDDILLALKKDSHD